MNLLIFVHFLCDVINLYAVLRSLEKLSTKWPTNSFSKRDGAMRPFPLYPATAPSSQQRIHTEISSSSEKGVRSSIVRAALAAVFVGVLVAGFLGSVYASHSLETSSSKSYSIEFSSIASNLATLMTNTLEQDRKSLSVLSESLARPRGGSFADFVRVSEAGRDPNQQEILQWVPRVNDSMRAVLEVATCASVLNSTSSPSPCSLKQVRQALATAPA